MYIQEHSAVYSEGSQQHCVLIIEDEPRYRWPYSAQRGNVLLPACTRLRHARKRAYTPDIFIVYFYRDALRLSFNANNAG